jgi:hypothetical protein
MRFAIALALATCSLAEAVGAQVLRVELRDSVTNGAVVGALLAAVDSSGTVAVEGLSDVAGGGALRLPGAGTWRVRVRRIGFAPVLSAPVRVAAGGSARLELRLTSARAGLPVVRVAARRGECRASPEGRDRSAVLWEQLTLALRASALARDVVPLRVVRMQRELDARLGLVSERVVSLGVGTGRPFDAIAPDTLAARGYVVRDDDGGWRFFAPDDSVLLDRSFVDTHCFDAPSRDRTPGLAELRFRPVSALRPDVEGTAYVDTASGEPRRLDFRFTLPIGLLPVPVPHAGGHIALARLPSGLWIVSSWAIRMPLFGTDPSNGRPRVAGYREVSGTAEPSRIGREALIAAATAPRERDSVTVTVRVLDDRYERLAGAQLLRDTTATAAFGPVTDSTGAARLVVLARAEVTLRVRRVGHAVRDTVVRTSGRDTTLAVVLPRIQRLATTTVTETLEDRVGFTMRRRAGFGWFMDSLDVAMRGAPNALGLLQGVPSLSLYRVPATAGAAAGRPTDPRAGAVAAHPDWLPGMMVPVMETPTSLTGAGGLCIPDLFIDGQRASTAQYLALDTRDVRAVEFFTRGVTVPPQFQVLRTDVCGVVLVWTRFAR